MKILTLKLTNFKSIQDLTIDFNGKDALISGPNGVGKTTVFDAFNWLISGKDSNNKTENNFGIKTKVNGEVLHNLVHSVEATIKHGAKTTTLRREFREIWTKKRGSNKKSFTGHTTDYFIDEVPMKEKDYSAQVEAIVACDFQMYSNPMYFSEKLSEKERREMLIDAFGNIDDKDVILKDRNLKPLADLLESKDIDAIKATAKGKMKVANKSLEEIPARIDELNNSISNILVTDESMEDLKDAVTAADALKSDHMANVSKIKAEAGKTSVDDAISAKKREIAGLKSTFDIDKRETLADVDEKIRMAERNHKDAMHEFQLDAKKLSECEMITIPGINNELEKLRKAFKLIRAEAYQQPEITTMCPTCGQDLPADEVEAAKQKNLEAFNQTKADSLETLNATGKALGVQLKDKEESLEVFKGKLEACENSVKSTAFILDNATKAKSDLIFTETWTTQQSELDNLLKQRVGEMTVDISALCEVDSTAIVALNDKIDTCNRKMAEKRQIDTSKKRINELMEQEEAAQKSYEENEALLMLCESFTKAKMSMISELINGEFKLASFLLFDVQINGGIKECCVVCGKDGVAWDEALNTGAKINIGLDVIETFSRVNGVELPIFIDNFESVTKIQLIENQVIRLSHDAEETALNIFCNTKN